jgi:hypothetical protein
LPNSTQAAATAPAGHPDARALQLWDTLRTNRRIARQAVRSFDARYVLTLKSSPMGTALDVTGEVQHAHLIEHDGKYLEECAFDWTGRPHLGSLPDFWAVAFDGRAGWKRLSLQSDSVIIGTSERVWRRPSPSPLDFMSFAEPEYLQKQIDAGVFELIGARQVDAADKSTIEVQIASPRTGGRGTLVYSVNQGFLPVHTRDEARARDGLVEGEAFVDEVRECHGTDGVSVFFPIRARRETFIGRAKSAASEETLSVDVATLRVNLDIPDQTFALHPLPGEKIFDADHGHYLSAGDIANLEAATTAP